MVVDISGDPDFQGASGFLSKFKKLIKGKKAKIKGAIREGIDLVSTPAQAAPAQAEPSQDDKVFGILPKKYALPVAAGAGVLLFMAFKKRG